MTLEKIKDKYAQDNDCIDWEDYINDQPSWKVEPVMSEIAKRYASAKLAEAAEKAKSYYRETGREGCTYGDTDFDSLSVAYGYNLAADEYNERLQKVFTAIPLD